MTDILDQHIGEDGKTNYQRKLDVLSEIRVKALENRNGIIYAMMCDELGVDIEDELLYEQGHADLKSKLSGSDMNKINAAEFLKQAGGFSIEDILSGTADKKYVLQTIFPEYFGPGGEFDFDSEGTSDFGIGSIFNVAYEACSKYLK